MRHLRSFLLRLSGLFHRSRRERELADEIEAHLELHIEDNLRAGMPPAQARREARLKFGSIDAAKEAYRDRRGLPLLETFAQDLRYGSRTLRKNPAFAVVAILTLALGIGANTAMYSVVRAVMLRPLPARDPERLVRVYETNLSRGFATFSASIPNYSSWKGALRSLEFGAYIRVARNWSADGEAQRLDGVAATVSYLSVLGTDLRQGRWFEEPEEIPGQHFVVVLSDSFWKRQFGQDPAVIGRTLVLDGDPYRIIGIARPGFSIPVEPDIWVPLLAQPRPPDSNANRANHFIAVIGRLRPGFTLPQANSELVSMAGELERQFPTTNTGWSASIVPLLHGMVPLEIRTALGVLLGAVGIVLLIACANVANLLLVRAEARRKEVAIRAALGAGAARISRQLLTESLLLSLTGGALGLALGSTLVQIARRALNEIVPRADQIAIDTHVLLFAPGVSIVTGLQRERILWWLFGTNKAGTVPILTAEAGLQP